MKALIVINEDFYQMNVGTNTSLAYILSFIDNGFDVVVFNYDQNLLPTLNHNREDQIIEGFYLTKESEEIKELIEAYKNFNQKLLDLIEAKNLTDLANLKMPKVAEIFKKIVGKEKFYLSDFDKIVNRLEPMKKPFPPFNDESLVGENLLVKKIDDALLQLKEIFADKKFNCPIGLSDKKAIFEIDDILAEKISTPTFITSLQQENIFDLINLAKKEYQKIYQNNQAKIVIKPENSAQSMGVFSINFCNQGWNLNQIQERVISNLIDQQIYLIDQKSSSYEIDQIILILAFIQNIKNKKDYPKLDCRIIEIEFDEIKKIAAELYNENILIQPFIEGVRIGDIRTNLIKNNKNDFYCLGHTYRKSLKNHQDQFTTGYSTAKSIPLDVGFLSEKERLNLAKMVNQIIKILNNDLREKYQNVLELGIDFLIVGDDENIFLNEINHHCVGLSSISEATNKVIDKNSFYEGGMGFVRNFL
jgi:hypothetical protein